VHPNKTFLRILLMPVLSSYKVFLFFGLTLQPFCIIKAQSTDSSRLFRAFPFPIVYYAPETRLVYGAGGSATFRFRSDSASARPSSVVAGAAYTQNKQLLLYSQYQLFLKNNKYYVFGEAGYYLYSYYFFGVGQDEVPEELYKVNYPRIKLNVTRLILPHVYVGFGYQFEQYDINERKEGGTLIQNTIPGSEGSRTSGLGMLFIYDTRNMIFFPTKGWYAQLSAINNGNQWGGDYQFSRFQLDITKYQRLYKEVILAVNSYNSFIVGTAPFQQQSQLGGNKQMRGYYQGRFTDYNLMVLEGEVRFPLYRQLGAVAFINSGALGGKTDFIRFNAIKYSYGLGLRYTINRKDHLNIRLDYAKGPGTSGIYFTIGEAF